ncbi:sodium-coupled monocarboxylate transporter 2-like isoform X2 [Ischnura elegans]|nr:sodium-coupled monocarboxylate transporter 2-like isoform X2 [Ischnura elegans]
MGMPAEMYVYGTQFWIIVIPVLLASVGTGLLFVPVFHELQLTSTYEYFSMRFDSKVRKLGSLLYIINNLLFIPLIIYVPGLAFSQASGLSPHVITPAVCLICIFYTSMGGLKAVMWADTLQTLLMFGSMVTIVVIGTAALGGPARVWQMNQEGGRIEFFNFDPDPTTRHSFWTVTIGSLFIWLADVSANQGMIQRFLSMPTLKKAHWCLVILTLGSATIVSISCYAGLVVYATYRHCDLISTKLVERNDQLLPYFVMDIAQSTPGLPGVFMAGIFSAALSSMSTGLNSMSGVIYKDFLQNWFKKEPSEAMASFIMKITCVIIGVICTVLVFVVEKMGPVIQITGSLLSVALGPLLAMFVLGMLFPWANSMGALYGGLIGLVCSSTLVIGSQQAIFSGKLTYPVKPVSHIGCPDDIPTPASMVKNWNNSSMNVVDDEVFFLFRVSYRYYTLMGFAVALSAGLIISACTPRPPRVDPRLLSPPIRAWVRSRSPVQCDVRRQDSHETGAVAEVTGMLS